VSVDCGFPSPNEREQPSEPGWSGSRISDADPYAGIVP
jgi:hypothetical protein